MPAQFSRRVVEWGILGFAILLLVVVFLRQARQVQAQAELAAVQTTLAALRTAAVMDHIQTTAGRVVSGRSVAQVQHNPFMLLQSPPPNYIGEHDLRALPENLSGWFFDPACRCVGYAPLQSQVLRAANGSPLLLFQVSSAPGPLQLKALDDYRWQGEPVR